MGKPGQEQHSPRWTRSSSRGGEEEQTSAVLGRDSAAVTGGIAVEDTGQGAALRRFHAIFDGKPRELVDYALEQECGDSVEIAGVEGRTESVEDGGHGNVVVADVGLGEFSAATMQRGFHRSDVVDRASAVSSRLSSNTSLSTTAARS